jgi:predicted nucleic acid-binding protein
MPKTVIADTSPLILFEKIDELIILKGVYNQLITTPEISEEFGIALPDWIKVVSVTDKKYQNLLATQVDIGEASTIALATEHEESLILLDDLKARKLAARLHLKVTGTLGVIHKAKELGVITKVKPLLSKIQQTDFRIADTIINELLRINNE